MPNVNITVKSNADLFRNALPDQIAQALEAIGLTAEKHAVEEISKVVYDTPESPNYVRTGRLRNSISHARDDTSAYVGTNVEYAAYVELGTSKMKPTKMKPRPYLRPAAQNYADEYKEIVKTALKNG